MTEKITILKKYLDHVDIFLKQSSMELLERLDINGLVFNLKANTLSCKPVSNLFVRKLDSSFCLYVDYRDLNNLTIKNLYPLL